MTLQELGSTLKYMYENAPNGESTTMIHLFGIKYAKKIKDADFSPKDILKVAGMPASYNTEISKGIRLSKDVVVR